VTEEVTPNGMAAPLDRQLSAGVCTEVAGRGPSLALDFVAAGFGDALSAMADRSAPWWPGSDWGSRAVKRAGATSAVRIREVAGPIPDGESVLRPTGVRRRGDDRRDNRPPRGVAGLTRRRTT
jgi:hypothetical protein